MELTGYIPQKDDVLFISCPYGGSIGIEVRIRHAHDWSDSLVMYGSETHCFTEYHYLLSHREFEPGRFYWIWRKDERKDERVEQPRFSASEIMENNHGRLV